MDGAASLLLRQNPRSWLAETSSAKIDRNIVLTARMIPHQHDALQPRLYVLQQRACSTVMSTQNFEVNMDLSRIFASFFIDSFGFQLSAELPQFSTESGKRNFEAAGSATSPPGPTPHQLSSAGMTVY